MKRFQSIRNIKENSTKLDRSMQNKTSYSQRHTERKHVRSLRLHDEKVYWIQSLDTDKILCKYMPSFQRGLWTIESMKFFERNDVEMYTGLDGMWYLYDGCERIS